MKHLTILILLASICFGTVSTTAVKTSPTVGDGNTKAFGFSFGYTATSEIVVTSRITSTGVPKVQTETTHYSVSSPSATGGTVTFVTAPASTVTITISRTTPQKQSNDIDAGSYISLTALEASHDKAMRLIQELQEEVARSIKFPITDSTSLTTELENSIERVSKVVGTDSAGNITMLEAVPTGSVSFSTFGTNIAEATNAAAGRKLLDGLVQVFNIVDYGALNDGTDGITAIQAATDAAEAVYGIIYFPPSTTNYVIHGTWYVGNVTISGYGATLELKNDASWSQLGSATRNNEAGILTKSAAAAGYGLSDVELHIEGLTIYNHRTSSGGTSVNGQLLLEQVRRGSLDHVRIYADTNYDMTPLDFYANVKNFNVSNCEFSLDNNGNTGGVWVRNWDTDSGDETENINFDNCRFYTTADDEILAIYTSTGTASTVQNINVNNCQFYVDTGGTVDHVITVYSVDASGVVRNVNISSFQIESVVNIITGISTSASGSGTVEHININNGSVRMQVNLTSVSAFGIRGVDSVSNVSVYLSALSNPTNTFTAFQDCRQVTGCRNTFDSGISLIANVNSAQDCDEIVGCTLTGRLTGNDIVSNNTIIDGLLRHNKIVTYNKISISNDVSDTSLILNTTDIGAVYVIGNSIVETYDSDTDHEIFLFNTYGPVFCNYNYYTGDREAWLISTFNMVSFKGNYMDSDGSGVIMGYPNGGYDMSSTATSGTGADTLKDTIIYADHLGSKGGIRITAAGTKTAGNGNKTIKMYFGTANWTFNAANNDTTDWFCEAIVVNTAAAVQRITWRGWNGTTITQGYETATEDTTANVTVKITGECAHASDTITQTMWLIEDL